MNKIYTFLIISSLLFSFKAVSTTVRLETTLGNVDVEMFDDEAPNTVANFLNYVNDGDYDNSIFHRLSYGFVLQGGQYYSNGNSLQNIPADPPVINEFGVSNTKYTIAMAKLSNDPNSATNNFYFNLADNSTNLDNQNGGFTVFGKVIRGHDVIDNMASLININSFPLYDYNHDGSPGLNDYVYINKAYVLSEKFQINAGLSGAWFNPDTNGQGVYLEVLPSAHLLISAWFAYDLLPPEAALKSDFGASEHRWFTLEGQYTEDSMEGIIILTEGGAFDSSEPVINSLFGSVNIQFSSCNRAVMTYEITEPAISGTIPLQRQSDVNVELCEQLAAEANQGVEP
ncbi:MAG: peptidylprolyl isomerase [Proteobacteria bacterium]|nr:peptidylprolyl isomerase [Pseudomonadota bacterium]